MDGRDWHELYLRGLMSQLDLERYEELVCDRRQLADELSARLRSGEAWDAEMVSRAHALLAVREAYGDLGLDDDREITDDLFSWPVEEAARTLESRTVIRLVNVIIVRAIEDGLDQVRITAAADGLHVDATAGGAPRRMVTAPLSLLPPLLSRLKRVARLDPTVADTPQHAAMPVRFAGIDYAVAVSVTPGPHGEAAELRFRRESM
jgi:type II secretory ATPase GspE/PulE/Tfp pilus assembly ATPase PilB-like protein